MTISSLLKRNSLKSLTRILNHIIVLQEGKKLATEVGGVAALERGVGEAVLLILKVVESQAHKKLNLRNLPKKK